jgi:hypothetical protein
MATQRVTRRRPQVGVADPVVQSADVERDVIARGVFTSVTDLRRDTSSSTTRPPSPSGGPTPIRRGASHDRCTSRSDGPLSNCHRRALREWLLALKRANLARLPIGGTLA